MPIVERDASIQRQPHSGGRADILLVLPHLPKPDPVEEESWRSSDFAADGSVGCRILRTITAPPRGPTWTRTGPSEPPGGVSAVQVQAHRYQNSVLD
jgi:hypothetical protein